MLESRLNNQEKWIKEINQCAATTLLNTANNAGVAVPEGYTYAYPCYVHFGGAHRAYFFSYSSNLGMWFYFKNSDWTVATQPTDLFLFPVALDRVQTVINNVTPNCNILWHFSE